MKTLVVGGNSREAIMASRLAGETKVYGLSGHENPSLVDLCRQTGGRLFLGSPTDPQFVVDAAKQASVDLAIVSSDNPLEAGVVDALLAADIKTVGPKRSGARIEWDKAFARNFLKKVAPEFSPQYWIVSTETETRDLFRKLAAEKLEVAVKPQGLTGGKGVKVMGEHLHDFQAAEDYALEVLRDKIGKSTSVVIEEKLEGIEFTVQAVTDGKEFVRVPVTFDFPFRYEGDTGPGTGGMGCISPKGLTLPFMNQHDYEECCRLCRLMLDGLREAGIHYNGVLNAGFFLTARGLRVMEFNARFGDPEIMNILGVLDSSFLDLMLQVAEGTLSPQTVRFRDEACVVKYLVAPEYAVSKGVPRRYKLDCGALQQEGIEVFFASSVRGEEPDEYLTTGASRNVALVTSDPSIPAAATRLDEAIERHFEGSLEFRRDIGSAEYLQKFYDFRKKLDGLD